MNGLQLKEGKFRLVPNVPDMPTTDADGNEPEHPQLVQYQYDYDQALSNSIEVEEESRELAERLVLIYVFNEEKTTWTGPKEGELYLIEGLTYKVLNLYWNPQTEKWERLLFEETARDLDTATKQVAILTSDLKVKL